MRNSKYLLPDGISYADMAVKVAELRSRGYGWTDIANLYQSSFADMQLTHAQWRLLLQNALYRSGIKVDAPARIVDAKISEKMEKAQIKETKAKYAEPNYTPMVHSAEYLGESHIRIGVISDTHFGSTFAQYTRLREFYEMCAAAGVTDIYHAGDLDDGTEQMHRGAEHGHHVIGANRHIDNIVANYPHIKGITTHFITGNHDASFGKAVGLEIGPMVAERRPDMHYLGRDIAHVQLTPNCKMELRHPSDGSAYARSYKLQKLLETYDWDDHPDIVVVGHYHKSLLMSEHRIVLIHPGCFEALTDFMRSRPGAVAEIGGYILDISLDSDGRMIAVTPTWCPYKPIKADYKSLPRD